jgi:hypothetical protein
MDAELLSPSIGEISHRGPLSPLMKTVWWFAAIVLVILCGVLLIRRIEGALQQPLGMVGLISVGIVAAAVASLLHLIADRHWDAATSSLENRARQAVPTLGLVLLAASLSMPGSPTVALVIFWVVLAGVETLWWNRTLARRAPGTRESAREALDPSPTPVAVHSLEVEAPSAWDDDLELPTEVTQQLTRVCGEGGTEIVFGLLRGSFQAGERSQNLHLAFCPPLESRPEMTVDQVSGPAARIKTAQVEPYGVRLELRLTSRSDQAETVVIRFEAEARCEAGGGGLDAGERRSDTEQA